MRTRINLIPIVLGAIVVLGIPPVLLLTAGSSSTETIAVAKPKDPLRALIATQSNLERFYLEWQKSYLAGGGDRSVRISAGWTEGLSTEPSKARGSVRLDMIAGTVRAEVRGLEGQPADLWLVDNQDGP